jgi:alginate O-acetyltransferase complex protein AlgI
MAIEYLPLMIFSVCINYFIGYALTKNRSQIWLFFGLIFNLFLIFFYKYFNFFCNLTHVVSPIINQDIPLGISFYTFTQIAYLVDAYKNKINRDNSFLKYFLFVIYFPHLIAGPVLHHKNMIRQFSNHANYHINYKNIFTGILFFSIGLAKKVLIADHLIQYVTPVFDAVSQGEKLMPLECWCGAIAYTFQLYFDFSGYSDMAIGLSKFFNFELPFNFNAPYQATSIIDFWRRWHMSLSSFLKDYLYVPLGGNRKGAIRRYINLMITMLIGGMWHGVDWTFVFWGGYHGLLLVANNIVRNSLPPILPKWLKQYVTFLLVVLGWITFRSGNLSTALLYYKYIFNLTEYLCVPDEWDKLSAVLPFSIRTTKMLYFQGKSEIFCLLGLFFFSMYGITSQIIVEKICLLRRKTSLVLVFIVITGLFALSLYNIGRQSEFIYFQF